MICHTTVLNTYEKEREVEIRQRGPCEEQLHCIVDELDLEIVTLRHQRDISETDVETNLQEEHAENVVTRRPNTPEEDRRVNRCEQRTV